MNSVGLVNFVCNPRNTVASYWYASIISHYFLITV